MTTLNRVAGVLAGAATTLALTAGIAWADPGAAAEPHDLSPMLASKSCGPTATDAAIASALSPRMNGSRLRSLDAGEVACARLITSAVRARGSTREPRPSR
ncbi:hypothetical protein GCM10029964_029020 [Kibdelosporangium lantanae]